MANSTDDNDSLTADTGNNGSGSHPYDALTPDVILDAVETLGFQCTGALLPLNSYENRVYRVTTENGQLAAKFYRPGRWSHDQILEEHEFALALAEQEIPVVAPAVAGNGQSLHHFNNFDFAVFPWQPGRAPEPSSDDDFKLIGRYIGRIHNIGEAKPFRYRPELNIDTFGVEPSQFLMKSRFIPPHIESVYQGLVEQLLGQIRDAFNRVGSLHTIRLHGDCHLSNILWTDTGPHIVDLDDCRMGPAVQDLWMLLSGDRAERERQLAAVLRGYTEFCHFNPAELQLIEALRTLRLIHYSAWLAQRWDDPAFPIAFPWFDNVRYWEDHVLTLREQQAEMNEPPLEWQQY